VLDSLGERLGDQLNAFKRVSFPDAESWLGADLTSRNEVTVWMLSDAQDIVGMIEEVLLGVRFGVQEHSDTGAIVDESTIRGVSKVVAGVMASVAMNVIKLESRVWCISISGIWHVIVGL
jgi:hypothetical protein